LAADLLMNCVVAPDASTPDTTTCTICCWLSSQALLQKAVSERAYVEAGGKPQPGFKYVTAADAERALALRRQKLHARFLGMWARRIMATPEQALVPLRERDHLLASKFEVRRPRGREGVEGAAGRLFGGAGSQA
jgi:hypothetical protein